MKSASRRPLSLTLYFCCSSSESAFSHSSWRLRSVVPSACSICSTQQSTDDSPILPHLRYFFIIASICRCPYLRDEPIRRHVHTSQCMIQAVCVRVRGNTDILECIYNPCYVYIAVDNINYCKTKLNISVRDVPVY